MPLTELAIRRAKPRSKPYKMYDSGGLFLLVNPNGNKWWRFKYRIARKEKLLSMGVYPEISLKVARERRDLERRKLDDKIDPAANRSAVKAAWNEKHANNTFEIIAREWLKMKEHDWAESNKSKTERRLEKDVFPWIGSRAIADISAPELLTVLRRTEGRGAIDTAHRILQNCGQIFRYAIATSRAESDPTPNLCDALKTAQEGHFAAVTKPQAIGGLMRMLHGYQGSFIVGCALRFAPLVFARPIELRMAKWEEIDFDNAEWNIPGERMKMDVAHLVPLSNQAVGILKELHHLTGRSPFIFPNPRTHSRPMSNNAVLSAMRSLGITKEEMCGHGFRAMARTVLDEVLGFRPDIIEHQLAHKVKDANGSAYNRTAHLKYRRRMMQVWSDYLEALRKNQEPEVCEALYGENRADSGGLTESHQRTKIIVIERQVTSESHMGGRELHERLSPEASFGREHGAALDEARDEMEFFVREIDKVDPTSSS